MSEVTNYFNVLTIDTQVAMPYVAGLSYDVDDVVYIDSLKGSDHRGTWVKILRKKMTIHNVKIANVYWDVEITTKP